LYQAYQLQEEILAPSRALAAASRDAIRLLPPQLRESPLMRAALAGAELFALSGLRHERPSFGIDSVMSGGERVPVHEEPVMRTPFGTLLHFAKPGVDEQSRVLIVAPLAGHFASLVRATVQTMLRGHDVYLAEWHNARDIPPAHGRFDLDDYIAHLIDFLGTVGPGNHLVAVCQPCAAALAATALLAADEDPCVPRSLTLIAGPIDARVNPSEVNRFACAHPIEWFERNVIDTVPPGHAGAGRRVYPGFLQAGGFVALNPERHTTALRQMFFDIAAGDDPRAARTRAFYEEYFAVLDVTAEFYLDTLLRIFQRHDLARGRFEWHARRVDPAALVDVALLTVEGENDDISSPGQTVAAHALCTGIAAEGHHHHLEPNAGHYGVFSGRRWEHNVYPVIRETIRAADAAAGGR
jgi:polyhydroxyalkanoate depolymerase